MFIEIDLIWIWFLEQNVEGIFLGPIFGEAIRDRVGGVQLVITAGEVRAVVPGHLLGGEAELELGEWVDVEERGDGVLHGGEAGVVDYYRCMGLVVGSMDLNFLNAHFQFL